MSRLRDQLTEIDAVICGSDRIAFGVIESLRNRGRDVPGDVSVIDNWPPLAEDLKPALATIDLGLEQLGRAAAQRIFAMLEDDDHRGGLERLGARLVIRASTMPAD